MHPALYRAYQFFAALRAALPVWAGGARRGSLPAHNAALVNAILATPAQRRLFAQMPPNDQRHALAVACALKQAGYNQPALLQAALLHDVAKSLGQPIIHRVLIVLFEAFWPAALARLSRAPTNAAATALDTVGWWRRPFVIHARHPAIGAAWAKKANCDPLAVSLIEKHQNKLAGVSPQELQQLLAALQWADNLN